MYTHFHKHPPPHTLTHTHSQSVIPPLTPQTPLTPDSMGQISPHPGMSAFTYPSAPNNYDAMQQIPTTPTQTAVSPIVTYQQNPVWASPTDTIAHFETSVDYSSPMVSIRFLCIVDLVRTFIAQRTESENQRRRWLRWEGGRKERERERANSEGWGERGGGGSETGRAWECQGKAIQVCVSRGKFQSSIFVKMSSG